MFYNARPVSCPSRRDESPLPPRLLQTLRRLLAGCSEKEIARSLGVSTNTVHGYVKRLYAVFGVNSRGELLARFIPAVTDDLLAAVLRGTAPDVRGLTAYRRFG